MLHVRPFLMGKALIIAEKPSVALDISKALGGFKKVDDYYESERFVLASAVGHLLELTVPEEFEVKLFAGEPQLVNPIAFTSNAVPIDGRAQGRPGLRCRTASAARTSG